MNWGVSMKGKRFNIQLCGVSTQTRQCIKTRKKNLRARQIREILVVGTFHIWPQILVVGIFHIWPHIVPPERGHSMMGHAKARIGLCLFVECGV